MKGLIMKELVSSIRNPKTNTVHVQGKYVGYTKCGLLVKNPVFLYDIPKGEITCQKCRGDHK